MELYQLKNYDRVWRKSWASVYQTSMKRLSVRHDEIIDSDKSADDWFPYPMDMRAMFEYVYDRKKIERLVYRISPLLSPTSGYALSLTQFPF